MEELMNSLVLRQQRAADRQVHGSIPSIGCSALLGRCISALGIHVILDLDSCFNACSLNSK